MKQINTTLLKSLIALAAIITVNFSYGKTYTAINSGKWSDAATWENGAPGANISADDQVIIKNHIVITQDIAISGTLTVEKGITVISNKTLLINSEGKLVNKGSINAKRIVNEGTINNSSMLESMNEIENKGTVNNNSNLVVGTNLMNFGGNVAGTKGTYFANGSVISSTDAKFGNEVKIYANPAQASSSQSGMNLQARTENSNVILTVNNPNGEPVSKFTIEKSYNGANYEVVTDVQASNNKVAMTYTDKNVDGQTIHYKVKVNGTNYLLPATVSMSLASASNN